MSRRMPLNRRTFLQGAGVSLALPMLEAMCPHSNAFASGLAGPAKRMVIFTNAFGMYPPDFFPQETGSGYKMPQLLKPLERHRKQMTVFSNLDHGLNLGHSGSTTLLNGIERQNASHFPNGNISADQMAAEWLKATTRFPSLQTNVRGKNNLSWTRHGVNLNAIDAKHLYDKLFLDLSQKGKREQAQRFREEASILDVILDQAMSVHRKLGKNDQKKLEEYLTSVRGLEKQFSQEKQWLDEEKPKTTLGVPPTNMVNAIDEYEIHLDLLALALQTDSTRIITTGLGMVNNDHGLPLSYHAYSHHGERRELVAGLVAIEKFQMEQIARFLDKLKSTDDMINGGNLLDHTMVLFGCGMSTGHHSNKNLPMFLVGGGFKHGEHQSSPTQKSQRVPACNLLLSMLQNFGLEIDQFGTSTATLTGLETS